MPSTNTISDTVHTVATVYGKNQCPNCTNAKLFLQKNSIDYEYKSIEEESAREAFFERATKELGGPLRSVPQIWVNEKYIGGYFELVKFINNTKRALEIF
jgi:glutaredoxin